MGGQRTSADGVTPYGTEDYVICQILQSNVMGAFWPANFHSHHPCSANKLA